jgi:hypothetical protein
MEQKSTFPPNPVWVPTRTIAEILGLREQTLRAWRSADLREGRTWPNRGRGGLVWRRFNGAVRYALLPDLIKPEPRAEETAHDLRG